VRAVWVLYLVRLDEYSNPKDPLGLGEDSHLLQPHYPWSGDHFEPRDYVVAYFEP